MKCNRLASQREDGGFDHFVTFGDKDPWDATDEESVRLASEADAVRLERILRASEPDARDAARYFASGPGGHFFTDSLPLAEVIVGRIDPDDDWTITDTAAGPQS